MTFDLVEFMGDNNEMQVQRILKINEIIERFSLRLSQGDAELLVKSCGSVLRDEERIEFGESILEELIKVFCDSEYIFQENFVETIEKLLEIFFYYKNESMDMISDDELLVYMKKHFDGDCQGSLDYLESTILDRLSRKARGCYGVDEEDEKECFYYIGDDYDE